MDMIERQAPLGNASSGMGAYAHCVKEAPIQFSALLSYHWHIECRGPDGTLKWEDENFNIVVNEGLDDVLDVYWNNGTQTATWFVGLTDGTPTVAAGDTLASHAGWAEVTNYSETNRQTLSLGSVASQSVDNSASKASFSINANGTTIGGAFVASVNSGTAGTLGAAAAFSGGDKSADSGDTLNVTVTLTASSS